jgi:drug/metabolite transporter (DMT)-like permease
MKTSRNPLDPLATGMMVVLCLCWGLQQVAIKFVVADVAPIMQIALRSGFAALVLGALTLRSEGRSAFADGSLWPGLGVGALFALEFLLIGEGLMHTSASHMVVFLYTAPMFAALGLHFLVPEERLSPPQWFGVFVAFGGIALAFLGKRPLGASNMLLGDLLGLLAGVAWGATTIAIRGSVLSEAAPAKTLFYQLFCAFVLLLGIALASGKATVVFSTAAVLSLGFQAVIVAFASYLAWFWLLRRYLASRLSILSFMTPLFGVAFGVLILHEPIDALFGVGAMLVLTGIMLVSGAELLHGWRNRKRVLAAKA